MYKLKILSVTVVVLLSTILSKAYSQNLSDTLSMSLYECLDYAKANSITLQQAKLDISDSQATQLAAKGAMLPTVSGSISQSVSSNPLDNSSSGSNTSYVGSYGVDLSYNLYSGGKNKAQLKQSALGVDMASYKFEELDNSLEVSITETYIEILYAIEQIDVEQKSLELSIENLERGEAFFEAGSINSAEYAQLESDKATSEYNLILAKSLLSNLYVELKHLLEISQEISFSVKVPELSNSLFMEALPTVWQVYSSSLTFRPEIAYSKMGIESAALDKAIAKSGYMPSISFTAGTGVNHNSASSFGFSDQLRNNFSTSAGISIKVPIFSGYVNKTNVIRAENSAINAELALTQAEKELYQVIETIHNNAVNAQAKFIVAETKLKATEKSMLLTTQQYELGMKNIVELLTEQDNYNQANQEYLINKYQLIYNKALLNFYMFNIIKI